MMNSSKASDEIVHWSFPAPTTPDRDRPLDADTVAYRVVGDLRLALVLGSGLVMQGLHPTVDAGVDQHSYYAEQPWTRLFSTLMPVLGCVYDGLDAEMTGKRVRAAHKRIQGVDPKGRKYAAMDPDAYRWVWATIFDSVIRVQARFGTPLPDDEQRTFFHEWRYVGLTMGLRPRDMPADLAEFNTYYEQMIALRLEPGVVPTTTLALLADAPAPPGWPLGTPAWRIIRRPIMRVLQKATIGTLPENARHIVDVKWDRADELELTLYGTAIAALFAVLPTRVKYFPRAYQGIRNGQH